MLCRKIDQLLNLKATITARKTALNSHTTPNLHKWLEIILSTADRSIPHKDSIRMSTMNKFRMNFIDWRNLRLWKVFARSSIVSTVARRCRNDRSIREVFYTFKQTFLRPKRTFLLSAVAAYNKDDSSSNVSCSKSITDSELEALLHGLDRIKDLAYRTLFCKKCGKRLVIEKKLPGITYCSCKEPLSELDPEGWMPYMEAESVIIWRKQHKGQGMYAYRVYGRYPDVSASDFAHIQLDTGYRRRWDAAVAALRVLRRGERQQAVLHWEVLWPRLFTNRDYVYLRRHQHYDGSHPPLEDFMHQMPPPAQREETGDKEEGKEDGGDGNKKSGGSKMVANRTFTIISRSCTDPAVPETRAAVRVTEYWSHMAVRTTRGVDEPGMEFLLTYYDEPAVGGMPGGVASWATGRAAPAYLERMRAAALRYRDYLRDQPPASDPDAADADAPRGEAGEAATGDDAEAPVEWGPLVVRDEPEVTPAKVTSLQECSADSQQTSDTEPTSIEDPKLDDDEDSWWENIFPFYYFT